MAADTDQREVTEPPPEAIREEMEHTRSALTEKLEALEDKVMGTVEAAQNTVENTVEAVKETVHDTVENVKRAFDFHYQMQERPWLVMGVAATAGFVLGHLFPNERKRIDRRFASLSSNGRTASGGTTAAAAYPQGQAEKPGLWARFWDKFGDEIGVLQSAAIGGVMGFVRDSLKEAAPALGDQLDRALDSATTKLGGEPIEGPIFRRDDGKQAVAGMH